MRECGRGRRDRSSAGIGGRRGPIATHATHPSATKRSASRPRSRIQRATARELPQAHPTAVTARRLRMPRVSRRCRLRDSGVRPRGRCRAPPPSTGGGIPALTCLSGYASSLDSSISVTSAAIADRSRAGQGDVREQRVPLERLDDARDAVVPADPEVVALGDVVGEHDAGVLADAAEHRQQHVALERLRLVDDHERVVQRAAADVGERKHLEHAALDAPPRARSR